jgi:subtilase family serine protease
MLLKKTWVLIAVVALIAVPLVMHGQASAVPDLITQRVDESQLTTLRGNVHPLAKPDYDQGPVDAAMPMQNLVLVMKRSAAQESALEQLIAEQQDEHSPNYHKWLTPQEFGREFGPSDHDVQTAAAWLQSHGLVVTQISNGRSTMQFSGTAAQVEATFHTPIHYYSIYGEKHWANMEDPQIPTALTPAVEGVRQLHDFKPRPASHVRQKDSQAYAALRRARKQFTYTDCSFGVQANCYDLGPGDITNIYNLSPVYGAGYDGSGQTIAIMGQAYINATDISEFRTMFNIPPTTPALTQVPGDPPQFPLGQDTGNEGESDLDLEYAGGMAPQASLILVYSSNVLDSASYAIDNDLAKIVSVSYGLCESEIGSANNISINAMWQQAVGEGITVIIATGDEGASACENPAPGAQDAPGTTGLAVNGLASTPFDTAVGGTDFNDLTNATTYFSSSNTAPGEYSANGYVPEMTYNDSCSNALFTNTVFSFTDNPETNCVNFTNQNYGGGGLGVFVVPVGSGGGVSTIYAKPSWQVAPGVPPPAVENFRDIPDVSLFGGDGLMSSTYVICQTDANGGAPCNLTLPPSGFLEIGGTSASTQVFAGIVALLKEKVSPNTGMGLINTKMYEMAQQQWAAGTSCDSSSPASTCTFNDVTVGTTAEPCVKGSTDCVTSNSSDTVGILNGCDASTGYDETTGLGTLNAANFINNWSSAASSTAADFWLSLQKCTGTVVVDASGSSGSFGATINPVNGFTGSFTETCSGLPEFSSCSFAAAAAGSATNVTVTVATGEATAQTAPVSFAKNSWRTGGGKLALFGAILIAAMLVAFRKRQFRWSAAAASLAFLLMVGAAACGGGGTGGGGGGGNTTPAGVYNATLTVTSGATSHALNFTVQVR